MFKGKYYRNNIDVVSNEGIPVDAGSLWKLKDNVLILVDDDQYATHNLTENFNEV